MIFILGKGCVLPRSYLSKPRPCAWKPVGWQKVDKARKPDQTKKTKLPEASISLSCLPCFCSFQPLALSVFFNVSEATWSHKTLRCNTIAKLMFSLCHHVCLGSEEKKNLLLFIEIPVYHSALRFRTGDPYSTHHCHLYQKVCWSSLAVRRD